MATFDAFSGTLLIPALEINGAVAYTNLRFTLVRQLITYRTPDAVIAQMDGVFG